MEYFYRVRSSRKGVEAGISRMLGFGEVIISERCWRNWPARLGHSDLTVPAEGCCNHLDHEPSRVPMTFGEIKLIMACNPRESGRHHESSGSFPA